jgi:hypothetical protein
VVGVVVVRGVRDGAGRTRVVGAAAIGRAATTAIGRPGVVVRTAGTAAAAWTVDPSAARSKALQAVSAPRATAATAAALRA